LTKDFICNTIKPRKTKGNHYGKGKHNIRTIFWDFLEFIRRIVCVPPYSVGTAKTGVDKK